MCKMIQIPIPIRRGSCEVQDHQAMLQLGVVNGNKARRWKPNNVEAAPNCPRCASPNTKFCYYNNYSLSQPRYFCKSCRRYWTKGGFLRNIPVGGGSRKSRRNSSNSNTTPPSHPPPPINHNQSESHEASHIDMALVFSKFLSSGGQDSPINNEVSSSSNSMLCSSSTPESLDSESVHASQPSHPLPLADEGLISGIDELEWARLLGDHHHEVVQDVFWSHTATSSSLTCHQDLVDYPIPFNYDHHHIEDPHLHITDPSTWTTWTSLI